jgi:hypothetical protein
MGTPVWINYKERCHGDSDPNGNEDTFNRANKTLWQNFSAHGTGHTGEHDKDGDHCSDLLSDLGAASQESGTYTGTGANQTISLTDTGLVVKFVRVWSADSAYTWFASADMLYSYSMSSQGITAEERITTLGTGSFAVGTSDDVNKSGVTFYYNVWGV